MCCFLYVVVLFVCLNTNKALNMNHQRIRQHCMIFSAPWESAGIENTKTTGLSLVYLLVRKNLQQTLDIDSEQIQNILYDIPTFHVQFFCLKCAARARPSPPTARLWTIILRSATADCRDGADARAALRRSRDSEISEFRSLCFPRTC